MEEQFELNIESLMNELMEIKITCSMATKKAVEAINKIGMAIEKQKAQKKAEQEKVTKKVAEDMEKPKAK